MGNQVHELVQYTPYNVFPILLLRFQGSVRLLLRGIYLIVSVRVLSLKGILREVKSLWMTIFFFVYTRIQVHLILAFLCVKSFGEVEVNHLFEKALNCFQILQNIETLQNGGGYIMPCLACIYKLLCRQSALLRPILVKRGKTVFFKVDNIDHFLGGICLLTVQAGISVGRPLVVITSTTISSLRC